MGESRRTIDIHCKTKSLLKKTMLCVWWDQKGVIYYELLKSGETVNTNRYRQQMIDLNRALREKRPEYGKRQHKVILLHDNAPSHTAKRVRETIEAFSSKGDISACGLFSRLGSVRLSSIRITGTCSR